MENDDIKCLPDDFVGNSKPSKVVERLYEKRKNAEEKALEYMNARKKEICDKYEKLIEQKSEDLNKNLDDIKGLIKNELFDSKLRANNDNASCLEKTSFTKIYTSIQNYTKGRQDLVEEFYNNLILLEKEKSNQFKVVLKEAYEEIKKISFKLPNEYDKSMELEIENINQTILCNHRNYMELKNHLQLEIENDCKNFIEELRHVKECWVKYLRNRTAKAIGTLKGQSFRFLVHNDSEVIKTVEKLKSEAQEIQARTSSVSTAIKLQHANEWLSSVRSTLARLDYHSQKIIAAFKQAAVLVFNRFFEELRVIASQLNDMIEKDEIASTQYEMYTPTLEEIKNLYDVDLETIQRIWNDLTDQLSKTLDNTSNFLFASATLWEKHFKRTEVLQAVVLKDVDNTIIANNSQSEPKETMLNILIDNLRQEPTKEKLNKTLEDIKKLLVSMEELYKSQYQSELGVYKKYKATQEFKVDLLVAEIKRFLVLYPPDLEKDPKIQRKRASQTSEIADTTEALIPNQMMYCKYQIDAVSNWQFGVWEAITNYATVAKTEILAEIEKWVKAQGNKLDKRLEVRLGIHSRRMEKIYGYIYDVRLEELCIHQSRFEEHKNAVEKRIIDLKEQCANYIEKLDEIFEIYNQNLKQLESKCVELPNSGMVNAHKIILKAKTKKGIEDINGLCSEYMQKCNALFEKVKASNIKFAENMKLFSEGGNFAMQETKDYLKHQSKIEVQTDKSVIAIKKDVENGKGKTLERIEARNNEVFNMLQLVKEEHIFIETIQKKLTLLKNELIKGVCDFQYDFKHLVYQFNESRMEVIVDCGKYDLFISITEKFKYFVNIVEKLGKYLYHSTPVIFYSDKTSVVEEHYTYSHKSEEQDLTSKLFNFTMKENDNTFLTNLNQILLKNWNDIMTYTKKFYMNHHHCFLLNESKIHPSLNSFSKEMYEQFLNLQNQCETRWIQDTRDYLEFLDGFLTFIQEYTDVFVEEYMRKTLKNFDIFFNNEMRQPLEKKKETVKDMYLGLQKKLKPLYGHPNNRNLLEKLQVEAEIIHIEAREILGDEQTPPLDKLQERLDDIIEEFFSIHNLLPEIGEIPNPLKHIQDNLFLQLHQKVRLLKTFINTIEAGENDCLKQACLKHCKSFLSFYEHKLSSGGSYLDNPQSSPSITLKSELTDKTTSTKSTSLTKTPGESIMVFSIEDVELFLIDLKDIYSKCCKELELENFDEFISELKKEWDNAVEYVLDLYNVKYDQ